jgi:hypothetical protein
LKKEAQLKSTKNITELCDMDISVWPLGLKI